MSPILLNNNQNTAENSIIGLIQKTSKIFQQSFFALLFLVGISGGVWGQVTVTSTGGNGTGNGSYATLGSAFTALGTTATAIIRFRFYISNFKSTIEFGTKPIYDWKSLKTGSVKRA